MVNIFGEKESSNRMVEREGKEQGRNQIPPRNVPQFRRMYSTNSLQSQLIPQKSSAAARRLLFSHNKSSSDPTRFINNPLENEVVNSVAHEPSVTLPTLPLFLVLTIISTTTCWYLSDYLPSMSMDHPTKLSDYSIIWVLTSVSNKVNPLLQLASIHSWILGPAFIGFSVTTVTMVILKIDKVGGEQVESSPSLHLGEVVSVINGLLMFLYFLFYNLRVNPEHSDN